MVLEYINIMLRSYEIMGLLNYYASNAGRFAVKCTDYRCVDPNLFTAEDTARFGDL